jgi:dynein heavy chain 1
MVSCFGEYHLQRVYHVLTKQPRKIRQELDAILASTREMPSRMRQYAAFEFVQENLKSLLKANVLVGELKSEALRERHWSRLYKALKMPSGYQSSR